MEKGRNAQLAAASGIVAVILMIAGFAIFTQDIPKLDDPTRDWQSFFVEHQDRAQLGATIVGVGLFFYLWFLGTLRAAIAAAEAGTGRLASIAFGGGLVGLAAFVIGVTGILTAALHPQSLDPATTRAVYELGALTAAPAAAGFVALFAATAIAGYRHGALPAPIAGFAALGAILQLSAYGIGSTDSGAFSADGAIGLWVPFISFVIPWVLISGTLVKRAGQAA